jgi:hypothetical protein
MAAPTGAQHVDRVEFGCQLGAVVAPSGRHHEGMQVGGTSGVRNYQRHVE